MSDRGSSSWALDSSSSMSLAKSPGCEACGAEVFADYRHLCLRCGLRLSSLSPSPSPSPPSPSSQDLQILRDLRRDLQVLVDGGSSMRCSRQRSRSPSAASRDVQVLRDLHPLAAPPMTNRPAGTRTRKTQKENRRKKRLWEEKRRRAEVTPQNSPRQRSRSPSPSSRDLQPSPRADAASSIHRAPGHVLSGFLGVKPAIMPRGSVGHTSLPATQPWFDSGSPAFSGGGHRMGTKQKARASSSLGVKQIMPRGELWGKARAKQKARATAFVEGHAVVSTEDTPQEEMKPVPFACAGCDCL